ncbi:MAG: CGNR zinc finger domain-containing protein [Streptosporangiales bacterium]
MDLTSYAELAVRLVNTGGGSADASRPDELASTESYRALMTGQDYPSGRVSPADLDALRQLRGDLRLIFSACTIGSAEDAAARLNALLARHPIHPEIARHDDQAWHLHHATSGSVADQYAAGAVLGLTRVITELGVGRLRHCEAAACPNSFVDLTAAGSQSYCGDRCAATANVTALHERRRPPEAGQATTVAG